MPQFPEQPPWDLEWCMNCQQFYGYPRGPRVTCAVSHRPGTCCHYGQTLLTVTAVRVIGTEGRAVPHVGGEAGQ